MINAQLLKERHRPPKRCLSSYANLCSK